MSAASFDWQRDGAGWICQMPGNVTLVVTPDRYAKTAVSVPARGTKWHAQASHWDAASRTMSRFGRDEYLNLQPDHQSARRVAESIYLDAFECSFVRAGTTA